MSIAVAAQTSNLRTLGRHRILAKLGQGGMADVYLTVVQGQQGVTKLLVAKVLREELALDQDYRAMFVKEARVATLLNHRNLVQSFEVDEAEGHHYITMEYLDGRPLHVVLSAIGRDAMPLEVHVAILALALAGLHAAHEQKDFTGQNLDLVHRDVSPQNVFVTYDGEVKVVDFGVAKVRGVGAVTQTGALVGKIGYMAPEQALEETVDRRADVFAVGIMLWEALAGRPFVDRGEGEAAALRKRLNGEIRSPREAAPDAPEALLSVCEKAIAFAPGDRYETAAAFEEALNAYLESRGARIGAKEISAIVAPPFAKDRASVRALIETQLASPDKDAGSLPSISVGGVSEGGAPSVAVDSRVTARSSRSPAPLFGAVLVVGVAALAAGRALTPHSPAMSAPAAAPTPSPPTSAPTASSTASLVADDRPRAADVVRVRVRVTPPQAYVTLDGKPLPMNPFAGNLKADALPHLLEATADGYAPMKHSLALAEDIDVDLALVPVRAARGPANATPRGTVVSSPRLPTRPVDDKDPYTQ